MSQNEVATNTGIVANLCDIFQRTLNIGATSSEILVSVLLFSVISLVGWVLYIVVSRCITIWVKKTTTTLDDEIAEIVKVIVATLIGILVIRFSLSPLSFLEQYSNVLDSVFLITQILLIAYAVSKIINIFIDGITNRTANKNQKNTKHSTFLLKKVVTAAVFVIAIILLLNLLEFTGTWETTIASLGIGAVVVGFALNSTLSDLFSAFTIYIDRPFEIDDFIVVGEHSGTVKNIGILTTRLQLLQGEELVVSNKELTSSYVRNFRKLKKRRIVFNIGVSYDTPTETLKKIPSIIIDVIKNVKGASPQFVNFNEFGEYSLRFFISYFVNVPDYGSYLEVQERINLAIREAFEREGIEMAYLKNITLLRR
ncbi:MAG: mechanosensitive ion channel family protein [Nitrososphaerota archaeon]|jgi:small-conductance mechanosensitive channel|nr:mechanosensitive ion channel family protein [Nitrososphaerota archaeon]